MVEVNQDLTGEWFPTVMKLSKDVRDAARNLGTSEVRFLVDAYYGMQKQRIRANNQVKAIDRGGNQEPHAVLDWLTEQSDVLEGQVKLALLAYAKSKDLGNWLMSVCGVGPVISAGLMAHIDWSKPTVGHIWRFAGLDPSCKWEKGKRRPWNASLKTLCWKIGESFIKLQANPKDIYGKQFALRKSIEIANNDQGRYVDQAQIKMGLVDKKTESWAWYAGCYPGDTAAAYAALASVFTEPSKLITERARLLRDRKLDPGQGVQMLPPNHIHSRARRWAVKLFLSHAHFVGHWLETKQLAPNPYSIEFCGHAHVIPPPNMREIEGLQGAWDQRQRLPRAGN
jgi:hypothetical protein